MGCTILDDMSFFTSFPKAYSLFNGWSQSSFYTEWMDLISLLLDIVHLGISPPQSQPNIETVLLQPLWSLRGEPSPGFRGWRTPGLLPGQTGGQGAGRVRQAQLGAQQQDLLHQDVLQAEWTTPLHWSEMMMILTPALLCQGLCHNTSSKMPSLGAFCDFHCVFMA